MRNYEEDCEVSPGDCTRVGLWAGRDRHIGDGRAALGAKRAPRNGREAGRREGNGRRSVKVSGVPTLHRARVVVVGCGHNGPDTTPERQSGINQQTAAVVPVEVGDSAADHEAGLVVLSERNFSETFGQKKRRKAAVSGNGPVPRLPAPKPLFNGILLKQYYTILGDSSVSA